MSMGKFHFTKSTVEAACWCLKCRKETPWRIYDGRRQYCIPCHDQPSKPVEKREVAQFDLFKESK